jgi:aspartate 1-decarboxylase
MVIIATFVEVSDDVEARSWKPTVVHVDAQNRIVERAAGEPDEVPGPQRRLHTI